MKKRIFTAFAAILFALSAAGCSSAEIVPSFDSAKPWQQARYEVCEYSVVKTYVGGSEDVVVAEGTYRTAVTVGDTESTVTNNFDLTYNSEPRALTMDSLGYYAVNTSLTDSYVASATFRNDSLSPAYASKNFNIAQRPLCDDDLGKVMTLPERIESPEEGVAYRYALPRERKYSDPRGYDYKVNYSENSATFHTTVGSTQKVTDGDSTVYNRDYKDDTRNISVANNTRYDNEQLAIVVRALANTKKKGSATFYLSNIYDSYYAKKYVRYTMSLSCGDKTTEFVPEIDPAKYLIEDTEGERGKTDEGKYTVPCVQASVSISSSTPGPAITLLVTDPNVSVTNRAESQKTSKIVVQMTYIEYSPASAKVAYRTVYTLKSYSNSPF